MKKIPLFFAFFFSLLSGYAQEDKVYSSLDEALKNPSQVFILYLNNQKLTVFPETITRFPNLTTLNIAGNRLSSIPENITSL